MESGILNTITALLRRVLDGEDPKIHLQKASLILINEKKSYQNISESSWEIRLDEDQILEIEFLEELGDTEIRLQDQSGNITYKLQTFTVPSLHIIIDIKDWAPGIYSIEIKDTITKEKPSLFNFPATYLLLFENYPYKKPKYELTAI